MKTLALALGPIRKPDFMPALAQIIADSKAMRQLAMPRIARNTAAAAEATKIASILMKTIETPVIGDRLRNAETADQLEAIQSDGVLIGDKFIYWKKL